MARKRPGGKSRSQHIRDYLEQNPTATPNQIVEALKAKGITASVGLASNVKYTSGPKGKRRKRVVRKRGRVATSKAGLTVNDLVEAKKLAEGLGGIEAARKALDALAALQK